MGMHTLSLYVGVSKKLPKLMSTISGSQGTLMYSVGSAIDGFCGCVNPKCLHELYPSEYIDSGYM